MGFFSWECRGCNESIKAYHGLLKGMEWQNHAVCLLDDGKLYIGDYDGHGGILCGSDAFYPNIPTAWWHQRCWRIAGKPPYDAMSIVASDGGCFYNDPKAKPPIFLTALKACRVWRMIRVWTRRHEGMRMQISNAGAYNGIWIRPFFQGDEHNTYTWVNIHTGTLLIHYSYIPRTATINPYDYPENN